MQQQMIKTLKENLKWENYYSLLKITKCRQSNQVFRTTVMISKNNDSKPQNLIILLVNQISMPHYCFICTFVLWTHLINKSPTPLTLQYKHCKYTQSTCTTVCTVHFTGKLMVMINLSKLSTVLLHVLISFTRLSDKKYFLFHILLATHKLLNTCNGIN